MTKVQKSYEAMCATATCCFPTWGAKHLKNKWMEGKKLHLGITNEGEIICVLVSIATDHHNSPFIMDAVTGSLYRPNGTCCTSDYLRLFSHEPKQGLDKKLFAMRNIKAIGS